MEVLRRYTSFAYSRSICTDGCIILVDEPLAPEIQAELNKLETIDGEELIFLKDKELANSLEELLTKTVHKKKDVLFVFPGSGANYPRRLSRVWQEFPVTNVYAKRFWEPGTDPVVVAGIILPELFLVTTVKTVVVVDDVISSGLTFQKLYQNNAWRFTQAKWIGAAWISQVPRMRAKSGVNGYERVVVGCMVGKPNGGRAPINSLSTLREQPDIAENYARRHFKEPAVFLRLINY